MTEHSLWRFSRAFHRAMNERQTDQLEAILDDNVDWAIYVENYLGRVTKPRILAAVREGAGERAAQLIDHLKKGDMAKEAERLLADSGWLPEPLRLVEQDEPATNGEGDEALPAFLADDDEPSDDEDEVLHVVAAE